MLGKTTTIRTLLVLFFSALAIPLTGLLAFAQYRHLRGYLDEVRADLVADADAVTLGIEQFLRDTRLILSSLAEDPDLRSLDPERCPTYVDELGDLFIPMYTDLFTETLDHVPVCSARPVPRNWREPPTPPGLEGRRNAEGFHVGPVHRGRLSDDWTATLSFPLRDEEGERAGIVALSVDLVRFQEVLEDFPLFGNQIVTVLERGTRIIVARSRETDELVGTTAPELQFETPSGPTIPPGGGLARAPTFDDRDYLWGFREVPDADWVVFAGLPSAEVYGPFRRELLGTIASTLLVLILAVWAAFLLYRRISRPLVTLAENTARAVPGDPPPLEPEGPLEIVQVGERFNRAWEAWAQAEMDLQESLEWEEAIVEGSRDAIFVSDRNSRFVLVNRAAEELTGYERHELLTMHIPDLHEEMDLEAYRTYHDRIMAGEPALTEAKVLRADGTKIDVEFNNRRVEVGGEVFMHSVARDITARRDMERKLATSETRYRQLFEEMNEGFVLLEIIRDGEGRPVDYRYLDANPASEELLGSRRETSSATVHGMSSPALTRRASDR